MIIYSCSTSVELKKSSNSFLAYYNTFYSANQSFNDALEIIAESQSENNEIPTSARSLLEQAIDNSLIIEQQFYNTKYLDDAYFILGKSSYLIDRITAANYYFGKLCNEFPKSNYYDESSIMMGYVDLKIGDLISAKSKLTLLPSVGNKNKYLLYILGAEIASFEGFEEQEKEYYLNAIQYSNNDSDKITLYNKLLLISENQNDSTSSLKYINKIEKLNSFENTSKDLIEKWIKYSLINFEYELILDRLDDLISDAVKTSDKNEYILLKANVFILSSRQDESKELLNNFIIDNTDIISSKSFLAEAYFLLGEIELKFNFNYEKAVEYFELSIEKSANSEYGKKSEKNIQLISEYDTILEEIEYAVSISDIDLSDGSTENEFMIPLPADYKSNNLDSLSYTLAHMLYFDLSSKDSSLSKFKEIIKLYPESEFTFKSLIILDIEEPFSNWKEIINTNFPNSIYVENIQSGPMEKRRNQAWDLLGKSYEESMLVFLSLNEEFQDDKSLYSAAYISDYLYNNISNSINYYNQYLSEYSEGEYYSIIESRISEIKDMLSYSIDNLKQSINYKKTWFWINQDINLDSSLYYIEKSISAGKNFSLKSYSESLRSSLKEYEENNKLFNLIVNDNADNINIDSVKINLAHFLFKEINYDKDALIYYKEIVNNNSKPNYVNSAVAALTYIEPDSKWDSLLFSNVNQDSSIYKSILLSAMKKEPFKSIGSIASDSLDFLWYNDLYNDFFKVEEVDSIQFVEPEIDDLNIEGEKKDNR